MIDAAVATEAIDASISATVPMIHPEWVDGNYSRRLWASSWYGLFPSGDGRHTLTWSNRFSNLPFANIYNFYSSGEEVLRQYDAGPPLDGIGTVNLLVDYWNNHPPLSSYAWVWQEKGKGRSPVNNVLGSSHGGWRFNASYDTNSAHLPYTQANALPDSQLRTNAFFDFVSSSFSADSALYGASASTYAAANRNRILADAIPALTLPIGANPVPVLTPQNGPDQNFDMQALFENGWPSGRPQRQFGAVAPGEWHHSDIREVAYTFTYPLFNKMVILGGLK
jgi:hypothetical protein